MRTAHSIARMGPCRVRGEHLVAANQACAQCTNTCSEGRECEAVALASAATLLGPVQDLGACARRHAARLLRHVATYLLAAVIALLLAAAPVILDGAGQEESEVRR